MAKKKTTEAEAATKAKVARPRTRPAKRQPRQTHVELEIKGIQDKSVALVPSAVPMSILERLAKDRTVDVGKLERIIELQKDLRSVDAKMQFDSAFTDMQAELPTIRKRGQIKVGAQVRSLYAKLEDIHQAVKPILVAHGFSLRHRTEWPADKPGTIRVIGILAHRAGHSEESAFESPSDASDHRSFIQSMGSTVSYGRRYTTIDLLNLTLVGFDNDGQSSQSSRQQQAPPRQQTPPRSAASGLSKKDRERVISADDRKGLFDKAKAAGRTPADLKTYLKTTYNLDSTERLTQQHYDDVCDWIERPDPDAMGSGAKTGEVLGPEPGFSSADVDFGLRG